jgi:Thioesterase-like superfamily
VTVAPPHKLDADTALEPAGEGPWRTWPRAPANGGFEGPGPNRSGGSAASLRRRGTRSHTRPLGRGLTAHIAVNPRRASRSPAAATPPAALATLGELPDAGADWDATRMPAAKPLADTQTVPFDEVGVPAFMRNYYMRWALGGDDAVPGSGGWIRTAEPRALDAPLVAAMTDAWAPAAFVALGRFAAAPTLDLTIHIRRPLPVPGMEPEDYVLGRFWSRLSVAGVWEEDGELWSPGGELIAQSRQLALVRELRP